MTDAMISSPAHFGLLSTKPRTPIDSSPWPWADSTSCSANLACRSSERDKVWSLVDDIEETARGARVALFPDELEQGM